MGRVLRCASDSVRVARVPHRDAAEFELGPSVLPEFRHGDLLVTASGNTFAVVESLFDAGGTPDGLGATPVPDGARPDPAAPPRGSPDSGSASEPGESDSDTDSASESDESDSDGPPYAAGPESPDDPPLARQADAEQPSDCESDDSYAPPERRRARPGARKQVARADFAVRRPPALSAGTPCRSVRRRAARPVADIGTDITALIADPITFYGGQTHLRVHLDPKTHRAILEAAAGGRPVDSRRAWWSGGRGDILIESPPCDDLPDTTIAVPLSESTPARYLACDPPPSDVDPLMAHARLFNERAAPFAAVRLRAATVGSQLRVKQGAGRAESVLWEEIASIARTPAGDVVAVVTKGGDGMSTYRRQISSARGAFGGIAVWASGPKRLSFASLEIDPSSPGAA